MKINYDSLERGVSNVDRAKFNQKSVKTSKCQSLIRFFCAVFIVLIFLYIIKSFLMDAPSVDLLPRLLPLISGVAIMLIVAIISVIRWIIKSDNIIRLARFAEENNLNYLPVSVYPNENGMIFRAGSGNASYDILSSKSGNFFEIGNHEYIVGSSDHERHIHMGYIKIRLNRRLPHMVLDSKKNNAKIFGISITNLPVSFKKDQVLELEGDFNSSFTLYAPREYERDALCIFSPDLMALFIDALGNFDAEIVDDNLFIYSQKPFELLSRPIMEHLFNIIDVVGKKTISQTNSYEDEKVEMKNVNIVNESGRRLRARIPKSAIIATVGFLLYFGLSLSINYIPDIIKLFVK